MQKIRSTFRMLALVSVTVFCFSIFLPSLLLKVFGKSNHRWKHLCWSWWGYLCCKVFGIKLSVEGSAPNTPFILVSNHLSYTDTFILLRLTDGLLISKSDVRSWPIFGWMMDVMGIIFIDRNSRADIFRVSEKIEENLRPEQGVIFFPESTTSDGEGVLRFKTGLLSFAAENNLPVHYASINYDTGISEKPAKDYIHWWGDMTFFGHLSELLSMKKIYAHVTFGESAIQETDRKKLADALHNKVEEQYLTCKKTWKPSGV
jgi:1-acyl-sn-glycerol-3-phosphate acyltransferase